MGYEENVRATITLLEYPHIAQNVPGTFREPSVKTKETSQLKLSDG